MSKLTALKSSKTLHDVATVLGFKAASLAYILYKKSDAAKYTKFEILKRSGGMRTISAPSGDLKLLQRRLASVIQDCSEEITLAAGKDDKGPHPDRIAHGFKRRRSIITNAKQHRGKRFVFNIDIKDFFGSIKPGRVRGFLIKDKNFALDPKVATILAQIAGFENALPQGSPCSPALSNLIGHILDIHLAKLASRAGCTYSRYADDLTFSTNRIDFPHLIAIQDSANAHSWLPGKELERLVSKCGFELNPVKTRMQYRDSRQEVTGLVVNRKVNVRCDYRHTVRAMVHRLFTKGSFDFEHTAVDAAGTKTTHIKPGRLNQLHGMLGFIDGVDLFNRRLNPPLKGAGLSSKEQMFRSFLMYKEFHSALSPVLVCEGKTDNVYITHAIRSLAAKFPALATTTPDGKIKIGIRRFRYSGTSTGRILGIQGGSPDLSQFIRAYQKEQKHFKAPGLTNPVILLIDNDDGAPKVYNTVKDLTGVKPTGMEPFVYLFANLYLVATPLDGAASSCIEDCFDAKTKATIVNGKPFSSANNYDKSTHYGKADFAYKVVAPHADSIDFSRFAAILAIFVDVIRDNTKRNPPKP